MTKTTVAYYKGYTIVRTKDGYKAEGKRKLYPTLDALTADL